MNWYKDIKISMHCLINSINVCSYL